ncbi:MAG: hypothetical protein U1E27_06815 [Kiritimatiellia bacterium]|nr:hypothetical protein [Kiritimatiellia bacterium]
MPHSLLVVMRHIMHPVMHLVVLARPGIHADHGPPEGLDELAHLLPELRRTQLGGLAETDHV